MKINVFLSENDHLLQSAPFTNDDRIECHNIISFDHNQKLPMSVILLQDHSASFIKAIRKYDIIVPIYLVPTKKRSPYADFYNGDLQLIDINYDCLFERINGSPELSLWDRVFALDAINAK